MAILAVVGVAVSGFCSMGTGAAMGIVYFKVDEGRRNVAVWSTVAVVCLASVAVFVLFFVFQVRLSEYFFDNKSYSIYFLISIGTLAISLITEPLLSHLRLEGKASKYVLITIFDSLVTAGLGLFFVWHLERGLSGLILSGILSKSLTGVFVFFLVGRKLPFGLDFGIARQVVKIGFPSIFGVLAFAVVDYADRQMISKMMSIDFLGLYSIGYTFGMVMLICVGAFGTSWAPFFNGFVRRRDEARKVFGDVLTYYCIGFGVIVCAFFVFAKPMVVMFTQPLFHEAHPVVFWVALAYTLKGCYLIFLPGIYFAEKLQFQTAIEWGAAIVNIVFNIILIPRYGILGAAYATVASYVFLSVAAALIGRRFLKVDYRWVRVFVVIFFYSVVCTLYSFMERVLMSGFLVGIAYMVIVLVAVVFVLLNQADRKAVVGFARQRF